MKIEQINIKNFGKFSDEIIQFNEQETIVYGENEAGKSTLAAFVIQILFGFPSKTTKKKRYQPSPMPSIFGGEITFKDKSDYYVLKRYLNKKVEGDLTVFKNDEEIPESVFFKQIKDINELFYQQNFVFNQDTLQAIYGVSEEELMQQIYYLGVSNSKKWLSLSREKAKDADNIYRPRGRKQPLNQEIAQYHELAETLKQKNEEFKTYQSYQGQIEESQTRLNSLTTQIESLKEELQKHQEIKKRYALLADYNKLEQRVEISQKSFKNDDYQKVQELKLSLTQVTRQVEQLKETADQFDNQKTAQYDNILTRWPEVQYDYQEIKRLESSVKQKENDLDSLTDYHQEIEKIANLTSTEFEQAQAQLNVIQSEDTKESTNQVGLMVSLFAYFIAVVGLFTLPIITVLFFVIGTICLILFFKQNGQTSKRKKQQSKQAEFEAYLANYGLSNQTTINNLKEMFEKRTYFNRLKDQIAQDNQDLDNQKAKIATFISDLNLDYDVSEFDALKNHIYELQKQQTDLKQAESNRAIQLNNLELLQDQKQTIQTQLNQILVKNQFETVADFEKAYHAHIKSQEDNVRLEAIKNEIGSYWAAVKDYQGNQKKYDQQYDANEQHYEELKQQQIVLQKNIATLTAKQDLLINDQELFDLKQKLALQKEKVDQLIQEWLTKELTSEVIMKMLDEASENRFPNMVSRSQKYFEILTVGHYQKIKFAKNSIQVITKDNHKYPVTELSRGTAEQLYYALKFAFIEQISDMISLPVIIDDAFVNFDDTRVEMAQKLLKEMTKYNQVILFTARKEIKQQFETESSIELN